MNDFEGLLATDFGFKPQRKSAPMAASKVPANLTPSSTLNFDLGSHGSTRSSRTSNSISGSSDTDHDPLFSSMGTQKTQNLDNFSDLFGSSARHTSKPESLGGDTSLNFESMFRGSDNLSPKPAVYDKPVYDDDIFDGVPGLKSSSSVKYEDAFSSMGSAPNGSGGFDDLLGGFGNAEPEPKSSGQNGPGSDEKSAPGFDDLIPGFGGSSPPSERPTSEASRPSEPSVNGTTTTSNVMENPFGILESASPSAVSSSGQFTNPLEEISKLSNSGRTKFDGASVVTGPYDEMDPFDGLGKFVPVFSSERNKNRKERSPLRTDPSTGGAQTSDTQEPIQGPSMTNPESHSQRKMTVDNDWESHQTLFDMPTVSDVTHESFGQKASTPSHVNATSNEATIQAEPSPRSEEYVDSSDDVWLIVSDIPLSTQPTTAPPPSRPPPPIPARKKANDFSSFRSSSMSVPTAERSSVSSPTDELEDFFMDRSQNTVNAHANGLSSEEPDINSVAAATKEAMERAEAKFRYAKEVRGREYTKASRSKEAVQLEKDEKAMQDAQERALRERQERLDHERLQREREEEEREQRRLEKERERAREIEKEKEKDREQRRIEKERERAREIEREREKARQAVERATREARERAAAEARERAAVEARLKAERAAVQRAQAEARERAAAGAKERAEKVAAEARERATAEVRESQEKAAVARAEAEARRRAERAAVERAAAEARERAAAAARVNQQKFENDLESFFSMGRASSAPRPRANSVDPVSDNQFQNRQRPEVAKTSTGTSSSMRKASSTTNIVDDLSSIFGAAPSSGEFQEVEGENEERRRARLERHQRTQERTAKALAEKNQRDLQTQREQAERHRIAETQDVEIKRWAAGKEGNLRALLSTLQYVLWPECGWQPVSLTDLITAASVKKVYRKATLCIHPDKVQQKGANLQQKCIAEKVFDLLKEAWNKFNSEELF